MEVAILSVNYTTRDSIEAIATLQYTVPTTNNIGEYPNSYYDDTDLAIFSVELFNGKESIEHTNPSFWESDCDVILELAMLAIELKHFWGDK